MCHYESYNKCFPCNIYTDNVFFIEVNLNIEKGVNGRVVVSVADKRRAFEEWLERRDRDTYDRYGAPLLGICWGHTLF